MKILLMEDDFALGETIAEMLREASYDVDWVQNGEKAVDITYDTKYDLYIFDINVPKINGFELLESLREADDLTPAIFISAMTDIATITKGFAIGADDYIKKPFFPEELLVRVGAKFTNKVNIINFGDISYSPKTKEVRKRGKLLSLGDVQLPLLSIFISNIGRTISKENLLDILEHPSDTALRVAINKLKNTTGWEIQNIRNVGYRIEIC